MTLDQSALLESLESLKLAEVNNRVRQASDALYQALIDAELTAVIGTARTSARRSGRPGQRQPPADAGHDRASTTGHWTARSLHSPRRDLLQARVVSQAVVIATGVVADRRREILGFAVGDSEDGALRPSFLRSIKARGLSGTQLVISDGHAGLKAAIEAVLLGASWQRSSADTGSLTSRSGWSPPPQGEVVGSETFEVLRQACPSRPLAAWYGPVGVVPRAPR